jgi:hypothetical protein
MFPSPGCVDVAVMVAVSVPLTVAGGVYNPDAEIEPFAEPPTTLQVTPLLRFWYVAVHCAVCAVVIALGVQLTVIEGTGGLTVMLTLAETGVVPLAPVHVTV